MSGEATGSARTVGIVGLGLVGGSLARSLKEATRAPRVVASSLDGRALERALEEGVVDGASHDAGEIAGEADLVVYATPLDATLELLEAHRERWRSDAILTDVVSLKEPVSRKIRELGVGERWVGGHPMAGSEESGYAASRADLFRGARVYLVRGGGDEAAVRAVEELWLATGARIRWLEAADHDRRMVWASHLPQLVANALAASLEGAGVEPADLGPGGRDMTRLAGSSPELWKGLLAAAGEREDEALRTAADELERLRKWLADGRVERVVEYMDRTRRWREEDG